MILFASLLILALIAFAAFPLLFGWTCRCAWERLTRPRR